MSSPLQDKDDYWRNRRANGATPVFDPGMAPLGSDDEAGGASLAPPDRSAKQARSPLPTSPTRGARGLRLTPRFWLAACMVVLIVFVAAAVLSLQG